MANPVAQSSQTTGHQEMHYFSDEQEDINTLGIQTLMNNFEILHTTRRSKNNRRKSTDLTVADIQGKQA